MANSIHRPERCLSAQGWTVERSDKVNIPLPAGTPPLNVTKLTDEREAHPDATHTLALRNLNYYWFIGAHDVTASHWKRTFIDVNDRILYGEKQRWAYVTVAATVTDNLKPQGTGRIPPKRRRWWKISSPRSCRSSRKPDTVRCGLKATALRCQMSGSDGAFTHGKPECRQRAYQP